MNSNWLAAILQKKRHVAMTFFLLAGVAFISACSGGSSSNVAGVNNPDNPDILTGVFLDAPVEGLNYQTATMSGITDENGTFRYHEGETVSFMIGNVMLGSAPGNDIMTPIDLVPGAVDETDQTVTNICRLLQSLDWDGDPTNGIMITDTMRSEMSGRMIEFTKDLSTFNDYDMQAFFDTMNMLGGFQNGEYRNLLGPSEAQDNFRQALMHNMDYIDSINPSWGPAQSGNAIDSMSQNSSGTAMNIHGGGMPQ